MSRILTSAEVEQRIQGSPDALKHAARLGIVDERGALLHSRERMSATPQRPAQPNGGNPPPQGRSLATAIRDHRLQQVCG